MISITMNTDGKGDIGKSPLSLTCLIFNGQKTKFMIQIELIPIII